MSGWEEGRGEGMRLALFSDTSAPQVNGVARTLERLMEAMQARGVEVRLFTVEDPDAPEDARVVRWPSIPFWAYPQLRIAAPGRARAIEALEAFRPTLVHALTPFGVGISGRAAARQLGVPLVTSYHTHFSAYLGHYGLSALDAVAWPFLRWFHNSGKRTFVPSQLVAREVERQRFCGVRLWSRGVDLTRFHPRFRSAEMRRRMGAAADEFVVAYVGRLAPEKGIHVAIDAMRALMAHRPDVRFALAGDGPAEERCRATAPAGSWFAGALRREELSQFYASADAFVFPSTTETFGNVVLEAMAAGLPVVAPDIGATTELANDATALTFRAHSSSALATQLERLARGPEVAARLRAAGLEVARSRSWDAVWDRLLADYLEVANDGLAQLAA